MSMRTLISLAACAGLLGTTLAAQGAVGRPAPPRNPDLQPVLEKVMQRFDHLENALKRVTEALKKSEQMNHAQEKRLGQLEQAVKKGAPQPPRVAQPAPRPQQAVPPTAQVPGMVYLQQPRAQQMQAEKRVLVQRPPVRVEVEHQVGPRAQEIKKKVEELKGRIQARVQQSAPGGPQGLPPRAQTWIREHVRQHLGRAPMARGPQRPGVQARPGPGPGFQAGAEAGRALAQRILGHLKNMPPAARQAFFQEMAKLRQHLAAPRERGPVGPQAQAPRPPQRGGRHRI